MGKPTEEETREHEKSKKGEKSMVIFAGAIVIFTGLLAIATGWILIVWLYEEIRDRRPPTKEKWKIEE